MQGSMHYPLLCTWKPCYHEHGLPSHPVPHILEGINQMLLMAYPGQVGPGQGWLGGTGSGRKLGPTPLSLSSPCILSPSDPSPQMQHQLVALLLLTRFHCFCCLFKKNFCFCSCSVAKWGMQGREATARELHNSEASGRVDGVT